LFGERVCWVIRFWGTNVKRMRAPCTWGVGLGKQFLADLAASSVVGRLGITKPRTNFAATFTPLSSTCTKFIFWPTQIRKKIRCRYELTDADFKREFCALYDGVYDTRIILKLDPAVRFLG